MYCTWQKWLIFADGCHGSQSISTFDGISGRDYFERFGAAGFNDEF
jgi:hypothetical protein